MREGCSCLFVLAFLLVGWQFIPPESSYFVYAAMGIGVSLAVLQVMTKGLPETKIDPPKPKASPPPKPVAPPAPEPMTKEQLRRRFRKELREGIIEQDEFDALRDIYDF